MDVGEVIVVVNQMRADGVIDSYALGGAVAASNYLEPFTTLDVDIFVNLPNAPGSFLVTLKPIYEYLRGKGYVQMQGEYVVIGRWPVQFLPPGNPLLFEALENATTDQVSGQPCSLFTAEYLAAIALQLGRSKDKERVLKFIEEAALDLSLFQSIVARHGLQEAWTRLQNRIIL